MLHRRWIWLSVAALIVWGGIRLAAPIVFERQEAHDDWKPLRDPSYEARARRAFAAILAYAYHHKAKWPEEAHMAARYMKDPRELDDFRYDRPKQPDVKHTPIHQNIGYFYGNGDIVAVDAGGTTFVRIVGQK